MKCYRCDVEINESNASEEHIILNACGGRLKSKNLLCKKCNSIFGEKFDAALAKSTNDLANLLMIKRENGEPQPISTIRTQTGEKYYLELGGSPVQSKTKYEFKNKGSKKILSIEAKNYKELKKTLEGLKRKYPKLDVDKAIKTAQDKKFYVDDSFQIQSNIGGKEEFKSITKIAINFYIYNNGEHKYIKHLLPYLEGKTELDIVWTHYPKKEIYMPEKDEVSHVLKIIGDSKEKILYAYVELFNVHNFIVKLNLNYTGNDINKDYIFNVHTFEVKSNETSLKLSRSELIDLFENKETKPFDKIKSKFARILTISHKIQDNHQLRRIISDAVDNTLGILPEGTVIDEKVLNTVFKEVTNRFLQFIAHRNNLRNIK